MTAELTGFASLEQCYAEQRERGWGTERHAQILECLGRAVGRLNGARRQHGCLYPKHLFVSLADGPPNVALIDLEKSRRRLTRAQAARHDLQQLWRRCGWRGAMWQAFLRGYRYSYGPLPRLPAALRDAGLDVNA